MRKKYWDPVKAVIELWVPQNEGEILLYLRKF
jgi:hypothetical protein